jgi:hypothetical protein
MSDDWNDEDGNAALVQPALAKQIAAVLAGWLDGDGLAAELLQEQFFTTVKPEIFRLARRIKRSPQRKLAGDLRRRLKAMQAAIASWRGALAEAPDEVAGSWAELDIHIRGMMVWLNDLWLGGERSLPANEPRLTAPPAAQLAPANAPARELDSQPAVLRTLKIQLDPPVIRCIGKTLPMPHLEPAMRALSHLAGQINEPLKLKDLLEREGMPSMQEQSLRSALSRLRKQLAEQGGTFAELSHHLYSQHGWWALYTSPKSPRRDTTR